MNFLAKIPFIQSRNLLKSHCRENIFIDCAVWLVLLLVIYQSALCHIVVMRQCYRTESILAVASWGSIKWRSMSPVRLRSKGKIHHKPTNTVCLFKTLAVQLEFLNFIKFLPKSRDSTRCCSNKSNTRDTKQHTQWFYTIQTNQILWTWIMWRLCSSKGQ